MKKLHLIVFLLIAICWGCEMADEAGFHQGFSFESETFWTYDTVYFNNHNPEGYNYKWFFGDGDSSSLYEPFHVYQSGRKYEVRLELYHSVDSLPLDVFISPIWIEQPTDLLLKVVYNDDRSPATNCLVSIYKSEASWSGFANPVRQDITDDEGLVFFRDLDPIPYWIDAIKNVNQNQDTVYFTNYWNEAVTDSLARDSVNYYQVELKQESLKDERILRRLKN